MKDLPRIVIAGCSFAGYTAALRLAKELSAGDLTSARAEVTVVSATDEFTFLPSLVWVPFGLRTRADITFPLLPPLRQAGVRLVDAPLLRVDLEERRALTARGALAYDHLLLAMGPRPRWEAVPGAQQHAHGVLSFDQAAATGEAWERLAREHGPAVVAIAPGACCFAPAYELTLNLAHQVRRRGLATRIPITFVTPEPFLGHLGIGKAARRTMESFFRRLGVQARTEDTVARVEADAVVLADGERLPSRLTVLFPPYDGPDAVKASPGLGDARGFVEVDDACRVRGRSEVYAAGAVVAPRPLETRLPMAAPITGHMSEEMASVAAHNIAAAILGGDEVRLPMASIDATSILDGGNTGLLLGGDRSLEPRSNLWLVPGREAHWAKLAFERYFLATRARGWAV